MPEEWSVKLCKKLSASLRKYFLEFQTASKNVPKKLLESNALV